MPVAAHTCTQKLSKSITTSLLFLKVYTAKATISDATYARTRPTVEALKLVQHSNVAHKTKVEFVSDRLLNEDNDINLYWLCKH